MPAVVVDLFVVLAMQQEPAELVAMVAVELAHHLALLNQMQQVVLNQAPRILGAVVVLAICAAPAWRGLVPCA